MPIMKTRNLSCLPLPIIFKETKHGMHLSFDQERKSGADIACIKKKYGSENTVTSK